MNWLGEDSVLYLTGVPKCEPGDLARLVKPYGLTASITTRYALAETEIKRFVFDKGISALWHVARVQEQVFPRTPDLPALLVVLREMLGRLAPTEELVVVDPYLFPDAWTACADTLTSIITPIIDDMSRIIFVTKSKYNNELFNEILTAFSNRNCEILLRVSEHFHDRFWIADRTKGLFVGTSLNGLGKRYALADYMAEDDVKTIIGALSDEGILP